MFPPVLAAAVELDLGNPVVAITIVIVGLTGLLALANQVGDFIARFRRTPPIDQTLAGYVRRDEIADLSQFALKGDLSFVDERLTKEIANVRTSIAKTTVEQTSRLDTAIVSLRDDLEEKLDKASTDAIAGRREIHKRLETLGDSIQAEFRSLYRALGKVEGER